MKKILTILLSAHALLASAQCYPDRHNTSWNEGWLSCTPNDNPIPDRGLSHWIKYDFGNTYTLSEVRMWNLNDNKRLGNGFKDFAIDYSVDGNSWQNLGSFSVAKATGKSNYEGEIVADFMGDTARFVVLTALSNWGGQCTGFAEVQFGVLEVTAQLPGGMDNECFSVSIYPNPHVESFTLLATTKCDGPMDYSIYDHTGRLVKSGNMPENTAIYEEMIFTSGMAPGLYHLVIQQDGKISRHPLVKMMR